MAWWPFGKRKVASPPDGYTRALTWLSDQAAIGALLAAPETTAAAETAAGLLSRSLSVAEVSPQSERTTACISPAWLARVGSDLIRCGQHLSVIELDDDMIKLRPAHSWTVLSGSTNPDSWIVRAEIPVPNGKDQVVTRWDGVVCAHWQTSPQEPWAGIGPLTGSALTAALYAHTTRSLSLEQSGSIGNVVPVPEGTELAKLGNTIRDLDGRTALVPTIAGGLAQGTDHAPQREWQPNRIGPLPPAASVTLARDAAHAVLSACGVPLEMAGQGTGGSAAKREAMRQYERLTVAPIAHRLAAELTEKLNVDGDADADAGFQVRLDLGAMAASDMAGRARAFKIFHEHGYTPVEAAEILRLPPPSSSPQEADTDASR